MIEWDDLRFILAVARSGSALRAAQSLGVNQTTVTRRMANLEAVVGADLIERKQSGYQLTALGKRIAASAERVEDEVKALESMLGAAKRALTGSVCVTTSEMLASILITPLLREFRKQHPGILVELIAADRKLDLARGEADVALRATLRPEGAGIVARRLTRAPWSVYCSRSYADEHGTPATLEALDGHAVVSVEGELANLAGPRLLTRMTPSSRISARSNSLTNLVLTLKEGLGIAMLPCMAGDSEPDLVRCLPPLAEVEGELWLIIREEVKSAPHIRAFADALVAHVHRLRPRLTGESAS
jgi:DNA-binding transcriptional LysR family regulator